MELTKIQKDNYVHIQPAGALEICRVVGIGSEVTVASINDPFVNLQFSEDGIIPIALTEFWLKELSFVNATEDKGFAIPVFKAYTRNGVTVKFEQAADGSSEIYVRTNEGEGAERISYVHELQNFYTLKTSETLSLP
jgi:hypothetical protein